MASIRTAGLTKNFGDLRVVNGHTLDLPEVCTPTHLWHPHPHSKTSPKGQP